MTLDDAVDHVAGEAADDDGPAGDELRLFLAAPAQIDVAPPSAASPRTLGAQAADADGGAAAALAGAARTEPAHAVRVAGAGSAFHPAQRVVDPGSQPAGSQHVGRAARGGAHLREGGHQPEPHHLAPVGLALVGLGHRRALARRSGLLLLRFGLAELPFLLARLRAFLHSRCVARLGRLLGRLLPRLHLVARDALLVAGHVGDGLVVARSDADHQAEQRQEEERDRDRAGEADVDRGEPRAPERALGVDVARDELQLGRDADHHALLRAQPVRLLDAADGPAAVHLGVEPGRHGEDVAVSFGLHDAEPGRELRLGKVEQLAGAQIAAPPDLLQLDQRLFPPDEPDQEDAAVRARSRGLGEIVEEQPRRGSVVRGGWGRQVVAVLVRHLALA